MPKFKIKTRLYRGVLPQTRWIATCEFQRRWWHIPTHECGFGETRDKAREALLALIANKLNDESEEVEYITVEPK
jgi:hypothetical protein